MYKAAIFDLDGTLLNTLDDIADSLNHVLAKHGFAQKTVAQVRRSVGNGAATLLRRTLPEGLDEETMTAVLEDYVSYYEKHCREKTGPYPGILTMLEKLKEKNVPVAVVSNKGDGAVRVLCEEYFEGLVGFAVGEREGIRRKPAPDSVLEAFRLIGCKPKEALYIGDSEVDHQTAAAAGCDAALVTWGFRDEDELRALKSDHLIKSADELVKLFT